MLMSIRRALSAPFRKRRIQRFLRAVPPASVENILDVGGTEEWWSRFERPHCADITLLNIQRPGHRNGHTAVQADATRLPYRDGAFQLAFSNSVIEHVSTLENQRKFAQEVMRVGTRVWVQTPAREFPIEPHFLAPFVHYFPHSVQRRVLRYCSIWGWMVRPSPEQVDKLLVEIRLLSYREMQALFPDCTIVREKFLGLTKSYIAYR